MEIKEINNNYINIPIESMNCWSFIRFYFANQFSNHLHDFTPSGHLRNISDKTKLSKFLESYLYDPKIWTKTITPEYPDLIMFEIGGLLLHGGIVIGNSEMLHMQLSGSTIERYNTLRWNGKTGILRGFFRYLGK